MATNKSGPDSTPRFNYLVLLDIVVLGCILVVAGRPDGLAIRVTAIIVAAGALVYRCSVGVKVYVAGKTRARSPASGKRVHASHQRLQPLPADAASETPSSNKSWLRESD